MSRTLSDIKQDIKDGFKDNKPLFIWKVLIFPMAISTAILFGLSIMIFHLSFGPVRNFIEELL